MACRLVDIASGRQLANLDDYRELAKDALSRSDMCYLDLVQILKLILCTSFGARNGTLALSRCGAACRAIWWDGRRARVNLSYF